MIKIKREGNDYDEINISIRILNIHLEKCIEMEGSLKDFQYKKWELKNSDLCNFVVPISDDTNIDKLVEIVQLYDVKDYGIWVSLLSSYDHGGVKVPDYVMKFHKEIGGDLDFSYSIYVD